MTSIQVTGCMPPVAYMPNAIVQVPRPVVDYARFMTDAPSVALAPVRADLMEESALRNSKRHRTRLQVGNTNRWRLPHSLLSDLLGISQATRSVQSNDFRPFNSSYVRVCTAEGRHTFLNEDMNQEVPTPSYRSLTPTGSAHQRTRYPLRSSLQGTRANKSATDRLAKSAPIMKKSTRSHSPFSRIGSYIPERARPATTKDLFYYHSRQSRDQHGASPDVVLHCLGMDFELHSSVMKRSAELSYLLEEALTDEPTDTAYYKSPVNKALDSLVESAGLRYDNREEGSTDSPDIERAGRKDINHPAHISTLKHSTVTNITVHIEDSSIKKDAMAIALGHLYHTKYQVELQDLAPVLTAAATLQFIELMNYCSEEMVKYISYSNITSFYITAVKSQQPELVDSCIRWLELNLIPVMMNKVQIRDIPSQLMEIVLKSSRLFTYSEYHLYSCLSLWLFLRLNPQIQLMPTPTNVITYFNSLPKHNSFLETDGQTYVQLFDSLRLHGITDTSHFDNIRLMNILTQDSMVSLLSEHYSALQSGGDMALMRNFKKSSVRQGYLIDEELPYHCEILSLHGFHFHLKTSKTDGTFTFYMQRLKPTDPVLSFRQCERQTFSMRPDRDVTYSITVQTYSNGKQQVHTTGVQTQRFGLNSKQVRSKVLSVKDLTPPLYVTFAVLFPQS